MRVRLSFVAVASALLLWPSDILACSCVFMWPTLDEQFAGAQVVFSGEVVQVDKMRPNDCADEKVTFRILDSWKGSPPIKDTLAVVTLTTGRLADGSKAERPDQLICVGGCGAAVDPGDRLVVFAYASRDGDAEENNHGLAFSCVDMVVHDDPDYAELIAKLDTLAGEQP